MSASTLNTSIYNILVRMGRDITLRKVTTGAYSVSTGTATVTTSDSTLRGAVQSYTAMQRLNTLIEANDKKIICSAKNATATPTTGDKLYFDSKVHEIIRVDQIELSGTVIAWEIQARSK